MKFKQSYLPAVACAILLSICLPASAKAQGLELGGGYVHNTGDFGLDGFDLSAAWFFSPSVSVAANYDGAYDTSRVGTFEFTSVGAIAAKSHIQDFLIGPRVYFAQHRYDKLSPFGEAQFGVSHLKSTIQEGAQPSVSNSDSGFTWMLGGGADYKLANHWVARGELGLLRTHLVNEGQSRLRVGINIAYVFGSR
jgi:opacity protein-like surface antigen